MNRLGYERNAGNSGAGYRVGPEWSQAWWFNYLVAIGMLAAVDAALVFTATYFPEDFLRVAYILAIGALGYLFGLGPAILVLILGVWSYYYIALPVAYAYGPVTAAGTVWAEFATFALGSAAAAVGMGMIHGNRRRIQGLVDDLAERNAVLDAFFSQSPVALAIIDASLRLVKVNPYTADVMGVPLEQLEGKLVAEAMPEFAPRIIPRLKQILETGEPERNTLVSGEEPGEPGAVHHWLMSRFPIVLEGGRVIGVGMISLDVTDRVRAEEALERSEARFRTVFDGAGIGMTIVDMRGKVLAANPAFSKLIGYSLEELTGINVQQYAYQADVADADEHLRRMVQGEYDSFQAEKRYVKKDGTIIWGRLTASIGRSTGKEPDFIIGMIEDVTDRVEAQEALKEEQRHRTQFYRRTILAATEGKLVITERHEIEELGGEVIAAWEINGPDGLLAARHGVERLALESGLDESRAANFTIAVGEALTNVVKHAGGGAASIRRKDGQLLFVVSDFGPGIEALNLPSVALERGYTTAGTLGMGFTVMMAFSDRVYLSTGPDGTTVGIEVDLQAREPVEEVLFGDIGQDSRTELPPANNRTGDGS